MPLNRLRADPGNLKIMILSSPKTGNTWLRWLLHYAYGVPIVELPHEWNEEAAAQLPNAFVSHQHLAPSEGLVRWLVSNRVVVLTTVRHPGDTFASLFHFLKWNSEDADAAGMALLRDGDRPGANALAYVQRPFPQIYALSLAWARLGSHVVRYEDLLADPLAQLRALAARIAPVDEYRIRAAALLCKPKHLTRPGLVDPRHLRGHVAGGWVDELPAEIVSTMGRIEPYPEACRQYAYDWNPANAARQAVFDYDTIDPFHSAGQFDNGEPICSFLVHAYFHAPFDAVGRWPQPVITAGDSFWNWLLAPRQAAWIDSRFPAATFNNLMWLVHENRADLRITYPDPLGSDRAGFVDWFLNQAQTEYELPWGLLKPVQDAYCDHLGAAIDTQAHSLGRITRVALLDANGLADTSFRRGDPIQVEIGFQLFTAVERPVIGYSLRTANGEVLFGTNTRLLEADMPMLAVGEYEYRIATRLTMPARVCYVCVGLAYFDAADNSVPIHRLYDIKRISVEGDVSFGGAWCETSIVPVGDSAGK